MKTDKIVYKIIRRDAECVAKDMTLLQEFVVLWNFCIIAPEGEIKIVLLYGSAM